MTIEMASSRPPRRAPPSSQGKPTLPPPFDPAEFARESERKFRVAPTLREPEVVSAVIAMMPAPAEIEPRDPGVVEVDSEEDTIPIALSAVPLAVLPLDDDASVDERAKAIFAAIDGSSTVEEILRARSASIGQGFALFRRWGDAGLIVFRRR